MLVKLSGQAWRYKRGCTREKSHSHWFGAQLGSIYFSEEVFNDLISFLPISIHHILLIGFRFSVKGISLQVILILFFRIAALNRYLS